MVLVYGEQKILFILWSCFVNSKPFISNYTASYTNLFANPSDPVKLNEDF